VLEDAEEQSMPLTHVHMTVHSPIVRTTKTIVKAEVQSMPLTQVYMTVHSPIVRTTKTIVEAEVQSMPLTQVHMTVHFGRSCVPVLEASLATLLPRWS
jgi:hypothetical protein